jgi:hypothetical protein
VEFYSEEHLVDYSEDFILQLRTDCSHAPHFVLHETEIEIHLDRTVTNGVTKKKKKKKKGKEI